MYYYGLSGNLMLLASTSNVPDVHPRSRFDVGFPAKKRFFPVEESHDVVKIWESLSLTFCSA